MLPAAASVCPPRTGAVTPPVTRRETRPVTVPVVHPGTRPVTHRIADRCAVPVTAPVTLPDTPPVSDPLSVPVPVRVTVPSALPDAIPVTDRGTRGVALGYPGGRGIYGRESLPPTDAQVTGRWSFESESDVRSWLSAALRSLPTPRYSRVCVMGYGRRVLALIDRGLVPLYPTVRKARALPREAPDPDRVLAEAIAAGVPLVRSGIPVETVVSALARCWQQALPETSGRDLARLRRMAREYLEENSELRSVNSERESAVAGRGTRHSSLDTTIQGGSMSEETMVEVSSQNAEAAAAGAVAVEPKPRTRKPRGPKKPLPLVKRSVNFLAEMQDEPPVLEEVSTFYAAKHLRQAISTFLPGERAAVIARLARRMSWDDIAAELQVTADDVKGVVRRARERVAVYTSFFNDPWYWPGTEA